MKDKLGDQGMLEDEFKQISHRWLSIGRSSKQSLISIPKAIFDLPPEEKAKAFKELEEELEQYRRGE